MLASTPRDQVEDRIAQLQEEQDRDLQRAVDDFRNPKPRFQPVEPGSHVAIGATCKWPRELMREAPLSGLCWYAVHCAGSSDARVEKASELIEWESYAPKTREMKLVPKRKLTPSQRNSHVPIMRPHEVPLFPRHMFLRFDVQDDRCGDMFRLFGVQGILCDPSGMLRPAPIHDLCIAALKAQEVDGVIPSKATIKRLVFAIGERVRINDGPFIGHHGTVEHLSETPIEELDGSQRLKLLVAMFGGLAPVEVPLSSIEKL